MKGDILTERKMGSTWTKRQREQSLLLEGKIKIRRKNEGKGLFYRNYNECKEAYKRKKENKNQYTEITVTLYNKVH